jgi:VWFA-related protein
MKGKSKWLSVGLMVILLFWTLRTVQAQELASLVVNYPAVQEQEEFITLDVYFTLVDVNGRPVPNPNIDAATIQLLDGDQDPVAAVVEDPATPIYITLVIDASGSMSNVIGDVQSAAQAAIDNAPSNARFSVMQFNETWQVLEPFTGDPNRVKNAISRVAIENKGTCLYDAVYESIGQLEQRIQNPQERRAIILFTDGRDELTQGSAEPCSVATYQDVIGEARSGGVGAPGTPIHTIGLTAGGANDINRAELERMAAETAAFSAIGGAAQLDSLFQEIMDGLNSQLVARASLFAAQGNNRAVLSISSRNAAIPLDDTFDFFSDQTYNAPPPPAKTNISSIRYDQQRDIYKLMLGIANPDSLSQIIIQVWDSEKNVQVSRDYVFPNPGPNIIAEIETNAFEPGRKYTIRVQGVDQDGFLLQDEDGETVLVAAEIEYDPPQVEPIPFSIQSITPSYEEQRLIIDLDVSQPARVETYSGFIIDADTGQRIYDFGPAPFTQSRLQEQMPEAIQQRETPGQYQVTVYLHTAGNLRSEDVFDDFKPIPPQQPGIFARIAVALQDNPIILGSILLIIFSIIAWFMFRSRAKKRTSPLPRPPIDRTQVYNPDSSPSDFQMESVADELWPGERSALETPAPKPRLRLRILRTPAPQVEEEKVIQRYPILIGREGCDVNIIGDMRISRQHMRITEQGGEIFITDLRSSNGTFIGERKLSPDHPTRINGKQRIRLGSQTELDLSVE